MDRASGIAYPPQLRENVTRSVLGIRVWRVRGTPNMPEPRGSGGGSGMGIALQARCTSG